MESLSNLDNGRARACCAYSRCEMDGWVCLEIFVSSILSVPFILLFNLLFGFDIDLNTI